jgi:NTP pyrophosphatase (non-canonical NTP hydrolase)
LGDVLWFLAELCTQLGLSLEVVAARNIEKLRGRQTRRTLGGDGDSR